MTDLAVGVVDRRTGNLPAEVTRFIGRRRELAEVKQAIERSRLVTLCGVGGVGKTRLALRMAADLRRSFADGTWLVELSALREPELLARTVAAALRLPDQSTGDPLDRLAEHLADRQLLLVLDTCEHLVDGCAMLAEVLLRAAPRLRVLATSREPLDVMGEHSVMIMPLDAPAEAGPVDGCDSMELFADRAEAMVPGFVLSAGNEQAVAGLCRRLEGIPLAIELAAVRLRAMSLEQIAARLDDRFRLLGTSRSGRDRHQTLRAAVEWSHELCTAGERLLWARLSVLPGDFDLEAAEQICGGDGLPADALFDVLGRLVEKSIVVCEQDGHRYRLLDTIREYGAERLESLDERARLSGRHRDHYLALAERAAEHGLSPRQSEWLIRLRRENDNLRVALDHSLTTPGEQATGRRMAIALQHYWLALGMLGEGLTWYRRVLALPLESDRDQGHVLTSAAMTAMVIGELADGRPMTEAASLIADEYQDRHLQARVQMCHGLAAYYDGDMATALAAYDRAREHIDAIGHHDPLTLLVYSLQGAALGLTGRAEEAVTVCEEGFRLCAPFGEQWVRSYLLNVRGAARWLLGDPAGGLTDSLECLRIKRVFGDLLGITLALDVVTACLAGMGEHEQAAVLLGGNAGRWRAMDAPGQWGAAYLAMVELVADVLRNALPEERFRSATRRGAGHTLAEAMTFALGETEPTAADPPRSEPLTPREREVAALVTEGLSNREIAERLVIAKRTVDSHLEHILAKLGFTSRSQIAAWSERTSGP